MSLATLPNLLTLWGHVATVLWLLGAPWWAALVGLACDAFDGAAARWLGEESEIGSLYDWTVDVTSAAAVCLRLGAAPLLVALVPAQVYLRVLGVHASGRALLVLVAVALEELPWETLV